MKSNCLDHVRKRKIQKGEEEEVALLYTGRSTERRGKKKNLTTRLWTKKSFSIGIIANLCKKGGYRKIRGGGTERQ